MQGPKNYERRARGDIIDINRLLVELSGEDAQRLTGADIDRMIADQNHHWIIQRNEHGRIVAMGSIFLLEKPSRTFGEIDSVVTHPSVQGQGLGKAIGMALLASANAAGCAYVNLTSSRPDAIQFWQSLGFHIRNTTSMRHVL